MSKMMIICVSGPGSSGKSTIIRTFTSKWLGYRKANGDVLGIFRMPRRRYAVGVAGSGDNIDFIMANSRFLTGYQGLRVMICASRSHGKTLEAIKTLAKEHSAKLRVISTSRLSPSKRVAAIHNAVTQIIDLIAPNKAR
jgi:uncharacterized protein (DUF2237 family)